MASAPLPLRCTSSRGRRPRSCVVQVLVAALLASVLGAIEGLPTASANPVACSGYVVNHEVQGGAGTNAEHSRVWVPKGATITGTLTGSANGDWAIKAAIGNFDVLVQDTGHPTRQTAIPKSATTSVATNVATSQWQSLNIWIVARVYTGSPAPVSPVSISFSLGISGVSDDACRGLELGETFGDN